MNDNALNILRRIKVDALYGKKKHFNAADRKDREHYLLGIPLVALNIITTSILLYALTDGKNDWIKYIPIVLTLITSLLGGFQTYLNSQKSAEAHRRIGNQYLSVLKKCDRLQEYAKSFLINNEDLVKEIESIAKKVEDINKEAESHPTNRKDYALAKKGIESGEECYTESELNL